MPKYGLISKLDSVVIEKTLKLILERSPGQLINTCQIGVFDGQTDRGIYEFITSCQYGAISQGGTAKIEHFKCNHTAIDSQKDKPIEKPFPECNLIIGNSAEVSNQLENNSQHFIFVDGCHNFPSVVADFFCYARKVKPGGYFAFHDTGKHISPFKDYQGVGSKNDGDMYISVRDALDAIGMFQDAGYDLFPNGAVSPRYLGNHGFRLVFDEADPTDDAGGIIVFRKKQYDY